MTQLFIHEAPLSVPFVQNQVLLSQVLLIIVWFSGSPVLVNEGSAKEPPEVVHVPLVKLSLANHMTID